MFCVTSAAALELGARMSLATGASLGGRRCYDFLLKFIIVGDADSGKEEILSCCEEADQDDGSSDRLLDCNHKTLTVLIDGNIVVRLFLWSGSGQGRFTTIVHSHSKGAHGVLLVFDITNKYSFASLRQWLREVEEQLPGCPKVLIGNRLHLAFRRQVSEASAAAFAREHNLPYFEVSPLCNFNIEASLSALARQVLHSIRLCRFSRRPELAVHSLQELCARRLVGLVSLYDLRWLPLPPRTRSLLASYALSYGAWPQTSMQELVADCKAAKKLRAKKRNREERKKTCSIS